MPRAYQPQTLIKREDLQDIVYSFGTKIRDAYKDMELTIVCVLNGAMMVTTDVMRRIDAHHPNFNGKVVTRLQSVHATSYDGMQSKEIVVDVKSLNPKEIRGKNVLVLDDIQDTSKTLFTIVRELQKFEPCDIKTAVLLRKEGAQTAEYAIEPTFTGHVIPNKFVVGYGIDYRGLYRGLSYIGVIDPET